jgi:hypothetical protein
VDDFDTPKLFCGANKKEIICARIRKGYETDDILFFDGYGKIYLVGEIHDYEIDIPGIYGHVNRRIFQTHKRNNLNLETARGFIAFHADELTNKMKLDLRRIILKGGSRV